MVAEIIGKMGNPGIGVFVKGIHIMLVAIEPIQPTANTPVFVSVQRLKDFAEAVFVNKQSVKHLSLFLVAITRPVTRILDEAVMGMLREVPVACHQGEYLMRLAQVLRDAAKCIHAAGIVTGRQVDIPDVECTQLAREAKGRHSTRNDFVPFDDIKVGEKLLRDECGDASLSFFVIAAGSVSPRPVASYSTVGPPDLGARRTAVGGFATTCPISFLDQDHVIALAKSGNPAMFAGTLDLTIAENRLPVP